MRVITLLPADIYTVINKTVLTEVDKDNLISLYQPLIGPIATSLYLTLWSDLDEVVISKDFTHHHLMSVLRSSLDTIKSARETLEAVGLLKTYLRTSEVNNYVYELYSPLPASDFFASPIFNIVLYNNLGKNEYEAIKAKYKIIKQDLKDYEDISKPLNETYKSVSTLEVFDVSEKKQLGLNLLEQIDFDLLISSIPKTLINDKTFNKRTKELINQLAFIYDLDTLKMAEIIRTVINEKGFIDKEELRLATRKYYQYANSGTLPTLVYRTQPDYLKKPVGDTSKRGKIIYVFENTSPYDFLRSKYKSVPTARDLKILESLAIDVGLKPAVINVLIDYVLRRDNNKLNTAYIETIAGQWKRLEIETAEAAMEHAEKEHKKYAKKISPKTVSKKIAEPLWFNETVQKEEASNEDIAELERYLKDFR